MNAGYKASAFKHLPLILVPAFALLMGALANQFEFAQTTRQHLLDDTFIQSLATSGHSRKEIRVLEYTERNSALRKHTWNPATEIIEVAKNINQDLPDNDLPTISVVVAPKDLHDKNTGLHPHSQKRGRNWERPAYASFFTGQNILYESAAGLRIHGGTSRLAPHKSYRLHYRDLYGTSEIPANSIFKKFGFAFNSIIIHNDARPGPNIEEAYWHFINPLAYTLAEEIGCIVPATLPIQFYLNGQYQGPYVLTEHITNDFMKTRFGHDNFVVSKMKNSSRIPMKDRQLFNKMKHWANNTKAPLTIFSAEEKIDLENLTNWIISILYTGVTDAYQGPAVLGKSDPNSKWFWVNWDMDHAFRDKYGNSDTPWKIDNFPIRNEYKPRSVIFDRLWRESPEYRQYFLSRLVEVLNHILTPDFVQEKITQYEDIAVKMGIEQVSFFDTIRTFIANRPEALLSIVSKYGKTGKVHRLAVEKPASLQLVVDGYALDKAYSGYYFDSTPVTLQFPGDKSLRPASLLVNGLSTPIRDNQLTLHLSSDTVIQLR